MPHNRKLDMSRWMLCGVLYVGVWTTGSPGAEPRGTWPQWRGPQRDGIVAGDDWPSRLADDHLTVKWRVELQPSYSGPIVAEDRVFVTETRDRKTEYVQALNRADGRVLWEAHWDGALSVPFFAKANGDWIRATPAYDGECLFVAGIRDVLVCLDAHTGAERWRLDLAAEYKSPTPTFGFVSSPLVLGDFVYVQGGGGFVKVNKTSGQPLWRCLEDGGGMNGSAFSSPTPARLNGQDLLLVQTRNKLAGVDPDTGQVLWSTKVAAFRGMNILTPIVHDNALFTSSYGGGSFLFQVENASTDSEPTVRQVWKHKREGYMSTPVVIDGHAYLHLRNQRFTCLDLKTGTEKWTTQPYGKYWSLVAQQDKILALDERGDLLLIRATPEKFDLLDSRHVSEESTWAHLAVAGDEVFVRDLKGLSVYRWR
jgi:outer membrane protein assembly factor BamB